MSDEPRIPMLGIDESVAAGADVLVAGSAIFSQDDPAAATRALRAAALSATTKESA